MINAPPIWRFTEAWEESPTRCQPAAMPSAGGVARYRPEFDAVV